MPDIEICRWVDLVSAPGRAHLLADIDHVFFTSSARQSFADASEKAAFRERWLGRYLTHYPDFALIAVDENRRAVGYVIGSPRDAARDPLFADLPILSTFAHLTARYPAQLHVNLDAEWRGRGIGARLVAAFADRAREAGAQGVHVITARGMRNVGFYLGNGFAERGAVQQGERELLFLGKDL